MTKKKLFTLIRSVFWYLILLLPLIAYVATCLCDQPNVAFDEFMSNFAIINSNNPVTTMVNELFGSSGSFPIFSSGMACYFAYFVAVELLHVVIDLVLFVPTLLHGAIDKICKKDGDM